MKVILYTIGCPKCNILEKKLNAKNINFETITDTDVMVQNGIDLNDPFPILDVDDVRMNFVEANSWVNKYNS